MGLTAFLLSACASAPADREPVAERPFIKLAKREMALLVYWRGEPEPGYHQALERRLAERLKSAYHTEPLTRRIQGAYAALPADLVAELVDHGVDDVVLVETRRQQDRVSGRVLIRALATDQLVQKFPIPPIAGKDGGAPDAERVADFVALKITHHWTDPGSAPLLDPIRVANRLAASAACEQALAIYRKASAKKTVVPVNEIDRETAAQELEDRCKDEIARQARIEADRRATYALELDASGVSQPLADALQKAARKSGLEALLAKHSDKPVFVRLRPGELSIDVRYQVERYRAANSSRPKVMADQPVLHLHPYVPLMEAIIELKHAMEDAMPSYERKSAEELSMLLHLRKVFDDFIEIGFADDPALLISDEIRVKHRHHQPVVVTSSEPRVTRSLRFVLGPPTDADGSLTAYGLLWDFFELDR